MLFSGEGGGGVGGGVRGGRGTRGEGGFTFVGLFGDARSGLLDALGDVVCALPVGLSVGCLMMGRDAMLRDGLDAFHFVDTDELVFGVEFKVELGSFFDTLGDLGYGEECSWREIDPYVGYLRGSSKV